MNFRNGDSNSKTLAGLNLTLKGIALSFLRRYFRTVVLPKKLDTAMPSCSVCIFVYMSVYVFE